MISIRSAARSVAFMSMSPFMPPCMRSIASLKARMACSTRITA